MTLVAINLFVYLFVCFGTVWLGSIYRVQVSVEHSNSSVMVDAAVVV